MNNIAFGGDVNTKNTLQERFAANEQFGGDTPAPLFEIEGVPGNIYILMDRIVACARLSVEEINEVHRKFLDNIHVGADLSNVPCVLLSHEMSALAEYTSEEYENIFKKQ